MPEYSLEKGDSFIYNENVRRNVSTNSFSERKSQI